VIPGRERGDEAFGNHGNNSGNNEGFEGDFTRRKDTLLPSPIEEKGKNLESSPIPNRGCRVRGANLLNDERSIKKRRERRSNQCHTVG